MADLAPTAESTMSGVRAYPARVRLVLPATRAAGDQESDRRSELLALARRAAADPAIFEEREPYFWSAEISSNRLDSYSTRMMPSTLKNFAEDARNGVSFQNSHDFRKLGFGRSLDGRFVGAQGNGVARVESDFYTVPGLRLHDVSTDDFIAGVQSGVLRDVSVGFYGGRTVCSICGRDMDGWGWLFGDEDACTHFPGESYDVTDAKGNKTGERVTAEGLIEDARLAEVSIVYEGATPGAGVLKAQRAAEAGKLPPPLARSLELRYRIRLPGTGRRWAGYSQDNDPDPAAPQERAAAQDREETTDMADTERTPLRDSAEQTTPPRPEAETEREHAPAAQGNTDSLPASSSSATPGAADADPLASLRQVLQEAGLNAADPEAAVRALIRDRDEARQEYVDDALREGARAYGQSFDADLYRGVLADRPLATVKRMRDDWKRIGDALFAGGRASRDEAGRGDRDKLPADTERSAAGATTNGRAGAIPDAAYRTRAA